MSEFRVGDVVHYDVSVGPGPIPGWCRDGWAIATERNDGTLVLLDTYWTSDRAVLNDAEKATASVLWNLGEVRPPKYPGEWDRVHPDDRFVITSRNHASMQYIRKGAKEDHDTIVEFYRQKVAEAEDGVRSAQSNLDAQRRVLAEVEARTEPSA